MKTIQEKRNATKRSLKFLSLVLGVGLLFLLFLCKVYDSAETAYEQAVDTNAYTTVSSDVYETILHLDQTASNSALAILFVLAVLFALVIYFLCQVFYYLYLKCKKT
ncbi:MAG: hypothetical protein ACK5N8_08000 [Alphaproteobacteria bacterium]